MAADALAPLMSSAEMKPLLKLSRRRSVSCAVALTRDRQAVVLLHRRLKPRKLLAELKQKARVSGMDLDTATVRFGRAVVDGASDSAEVTFTVNKAPPGPMRMLMLPQMRSAGYQRCEFVVDEALETETEDGEDADDEEADEGAGASDASLSGPARTATALPSTAPAGSGAAGEGSVAVPASDDMAAARARLTQLALRAKEVMPGNPPGADAIRAAAAQARKALASQDVAAVNAAANVMQGALGPEQPGDATGVDDGRPASAAAALWAGADARAGAPRDRTGWTQVAQAGAGNTATDADGALPARNDDGSASTRGTPSPGDTINPREAWRYGPPLVADIRKVQPGDDVTGLIRRIKQLYSNQIMAAQIGLIQAALALSNPNRQSPSDHAEALAVLDDFVRHDRSLQPSPDDGTGYSPDQPGYHHYTAGPHAVCPAELQCSREEIADQMSRFAVPGQSPDQPVESGRKYRIYDPFTGLFAGRVTTTVSPDGLTTQNRTLPGHVLHDGQITRSAIRNPDGSWSVFTTGTGNNIVPLGAEANELAGPRIFDRVDKQMRQSILRHHGSS